MIQPQTDVSPQDELRPELDRALCRAEAALSRIKEYAEAAEDARITPREAVEQILDELASGPALRRVRGALGRSFSPARPH